MNKNAVYQQTQKLSLVDAAEIMSSYYTEGSELIEFTDRCKEDFYEYKDYA